MTRAAASMSAELTGRIGAFIPQLVSRCQTSRQGAWRSGAAVHRKLYRFASCGPRGGNGHGRGLPQRIGPDDDLEPAVLVLGDRGAAFDPVAGVDVVDAEPVVHVGIVDVAADDAVDAVSPRLGDSASSNAPMTLTAFLTLCLAQADSDQ